MLIPPRLGKAGFMILNRFRVTGQAAVVTGAGRGIGAATAIALAQAGADVLISARTEDQLAQVAREIETAGRRAVIVPADLNDLDAAAGLARAAAEAFGRLDIVVNNVGGALPRPFLATKPHHLADAFQFNVGIAHRLTQAAVPCLLASRHETGGAGGTSGDAAAAETAARGQGVVINISSVMGRVAGRGYLAYGTAKAALAHYTRLAAADLAPRIRVNAIAVGSVATSALDIVLTNDELRERMERTTPLGRIGDPEDIAAAVLFLASPAGGYITGKIIEVDGGLSQPNLDLGLPDL
jgi:7-alpha-hydroxysteroid dehydrogenase